MWNPCKLASVSIHVTSHLKLRVLHIIIKFPYNARSDWLKQRALSEIRERVNGIKLASKYLLRNLDKFDSDKININELFVSSKYGS